MREVGSAGAEDMAEGEEQRPGAVAEEAGAERAVCAGSGATAAGTWAAAPADPGALRMAGAVPSVCSISNQYNRVRLQQLHRGRSLSCTWKS